MDDELTKEAFGEWRQHPVTKQVMDELHKYRAKLAGAWAEGVEMGVEEQAEAQIYGFVANMSYEDLRGLNEDVE